MCLFCQSVEPNQAETQVSRSEGDFFRQADMEKEKKSVRQRRASGFRSVKKGTVMEEILWESVHGSRENSRVDETSVMNKVCLPEML